MRARAVYCSTQCQAAALRGNRKTLFPKPCKNCGREFQPEKDGAREFCSRKCSAISTGLARRKPEGLRTPQGYILVRMPDHPMASRGGYLMQHRLLMAESLGRLLLPEEVVHHINGVKSDNRIANLALMLKSEHDRVQKPEKKTIKCPCCGVTLWTSGRVRRVEVVSSE